MRRAAISIFFSTITMLSIAGERQTFINTCQRSSSELSGSLGYRICTSKYLRHLEKQQDLLLKTLLTHVRSQTGEGIDAAAAERHILASQKAWTAFAKDHCDAAQLVFGIGNSSGDVEPSCLVALYESRNRQLKGMQNGNYER